MECAGVRLANRNGECFHHGHVLHVVDAVLHFGRGRRRIPEGGVEDKPIGKSVASEKSGNMEGGESGIGEYKIIGTISICVGVFVAVLIGWLMVISEPGG